MFALNHGTKYALYAPFIQRIINYKTDMEFGYDGKHGAYQPHVIRGPATQLLLHPLLILRVLQLQPLLLLLAVHLQQLLSHLVLLHVEARSRMFLSRASRP
jgi:hypothetical protein